jgi:hypothetical protein
VCGNLPLDKKLPDEFREVWLASINSAALAAAGSKSSTSGAAKPTAATTKAQPATATPVSAPGNDRSGNRSTTTAGKGDDGKSSSNPAVMALSVDRKFASKAEARMAEVEKAAIRASKQRRQEALAKANADAPVLLSTKMVAILELCLGLGSRSQGNGSSSASGGSGGAEVALASLSGKMRTAAEVCVAAGFSSEAAVMAVMQASAQVGEGEADEEEKETGDASALEAEALTWLVLHVPEDDMPSSFRGKQGAHALPMLLKPSSKEELPAASALQSLPSPPSARGGAIYPGEGCYGFSVADVKRARASITPGIKSEAEADAADSSTVKPSDITVDPSTSNATDASTWVTLSPLLLKWTIARGDSSTPLNDDDSATSGDAATADAAAAEALENELMVVESMFAGDVNIVIVAKQEGGTWGRCLTVTSTAAATGGEGQQFTVDFWLPNSENTHTRAYPSRGGIPCVLLRNGSVACQCALTSQAARLVALARDDDEEDNDDAPAVLVDLLTWVQNHAYQRVRAGGSSIWEVEPLGEASKRTALIGRAGSLFADLPPSEPQLEEAVEALAITDKESAAPDAAAPSASAADDNGKGATKSSNGSSSQSGKSSSKKGGGGHQRRFGGFWDLPPPVASSSSTSSKGGNGGGGVSSVVPEVPLRLQRERAGLPAFKSRSEVIQQLNSSRVILVSGGTGYMHVLRLTFKCVFMSIYMRYLP